MKQCSSLPAVIRYMTMAVRTANDFHYVKRMVITWKLILVVHTLISTEYLKYKRSIDDRCEYDLMIGVCVEGTCHIFYNCKDAEVNSLIYAHNA